MDNQRGLAVILASAINYAAPAFGGDSSYFRKKQRNWDEFMDSLDWSKIGKPKQNLQGFKNALGAFAMVKQK